MNILIANRGEIAIRIMRAAAELKMRTVALFSEDDAHSLHTRRADEAFPLTGKGVNAYLDQAQILSIAEKQGCDAIHPGYGFLSENPAFAEMCSARGIKFIGPDVETLKTLGDKTKARGLAEKCDVPLLTGTNKPTSLEQALEFLASLGEGGRMMIKAVSGGGGRGMRLVEHPEELESAYTRCRSEALAALGNGEVYVEEVMPRARHIEVQIIGDVYGAVGHLWERECSIQRQHQKLVEIAPCPSLSQGLRIKLINDAVQMAEALGFQNVGTFEFLVDSDAMSDNARYAFIEANPRLQVEHTVTEEVMDVDIVKTQIQLAAGKSLASLNLLPGEVRKPRGYAIQVRVNVETIGEDGGALPKGGIISLFEVPSGRGIRTDTCGYAQYRINPNFDSLLAKVIGHSRSPDFSDTVARTHRALCEFKITGVSTNILFLCNILQHPQFVANRIHTNFIMDYLAELRKNGHKGRQQLFFDQTVNTPHVGAKVDDTDPLAVLSYGKTANQYRPDVSEVLETEMNGHILDAGHDGTLVARAAMQGTIVSLNVAEGDLVYKGMQLLVMNAMKMEHVITADVSGRVGRIVVKPGDTVAEGQVLVVIKEEDVDVSAEEAKTQVDLDKIRPDLADVLKRQAITRDAARPDAVSKRRKRGQRTARENIEDLCDPETFIEYGAFVVAAQRQRRSMEDLIERTPADGLVAGIGRVNGHLFDDVVARCAILSYDYTVLAGTQGMQNHYKKDRMFELAERWRIPVVLFTEGGGGRPGDTDWNIVAGLDCMAFHLFGKLSGLVPLVGINSGRCFAGNAALLGCCDVVIATRNSSIGMGGPAMIEGGGLGVYSPEEVGPMHVQVPNGVVDIAVSDEAEAVSAAKKYLSYFQGTLDAWTCPDQRMLRNLIPENRLRIYNVREVIETLADTDSVLELRRGFGLGMVTAFIRIEGCPIGVIANNPTHLSGAIDAPAADKAARFMQLCDAFDIPILFLCDTPGVMVGPEAEKTALVRHCTRMFVTGASLSVPYFTIVLRKSYGLGAQAMAGGSFRAPLFVISWPTGEFGGMGLEGAVKLGFRKELESIKDPDERKKTFDTMVAMAYERGKALNTATYFEFDDVIDPADSRYWIIRALKSVPPAGPRKTKKRPCVDTW